MESVTFALPSVGSAGMSRDEQGALIVNQATAVIIVAYLQHASILSATSIQYSVGVNQLPLLIDAVQNALKSF